MLNIICQKAGLEHELFCFDKEEKDRALSKNVIRYCSYNNSDKQEFFLCLKGYSYQAEKKELIKIDNFEVDQEKLKEFTRFCEEFDVDVKSIGWYLFNYMQVDFPV